MDIKKVVESLSPNERKVLPHLREKKISEISKKANLDQVSILRSLEYLQNKGIVKLSQSKKKIVEIGLNGALYKKKGLPERRLINILGEKDNNDSHALPSIHPRLITSHDSPN